MAYGVRALDLIFSNRCSAHGGPQEARGRIPGFLGSFRL